METSVVDPSTERQPKPSLRFEAESAAFGLRERERVRRLLLRRKIGDWIGTVVVFILAGCAVFALATATSKMSLSDNPSIQGFRGKK
ncbi:MAG TPA: hypothetical protein VMU50_06380 [Polyangia bacterium]|nr:hypothetical protein [Polyangia bacterium]